MYIVIMNFIRRYKIIQNIYLVLASVLPIAIVDDDDVVVSWADVVAAVASA